jgi:peptidoglycan hydrolase CwlO-like protein
MKNFLKKGISKTLLALLFFILIFPQFHLFSQDECKTISECEALYKKLEEELKKVEENIAKTKEEKKTRENQIKFLKSKIQQLELQIKQTNLQIQELTLQIEDTENAILETSLRIEDMQKKLTQILRTIYEEDQRPLVEILLTEKTIAGFFDNLSALEVLNKKQKEILAEIKGLKASLEEEKANLESQKADLETLLNIRTLQKQENESAKKEQEKLLAMTEAQYQQYLKQKKELEQRAAEVMARIAQLTLPGLTVPRDKKELYQLANWAGNLTSVRPALILGLIEVESALGTNVGQCNCSGQPVCANPELSYKKVMPSSQWAAFEQITKELGLNPNTTPVSCYVGGGQIQMGGAMGPAQFMPTTWLKYKERIENLTGVKPANPWRASDAFLAAGLYLADFGASSKNYQDELGAVTAYLCGTTQMTTRCKRAGGEWYRNLVLQKAADWEEWTKNGF